jgi:hypothetical protein
MESQSTCIEGRIIYIHIALCGVDLMSERLNCHPLHRNGRLQ